MLNHGSLIITSPVTGMTAYEGDSKRRNVYTQLRTDSEVLPFPVIHQNSSLYPFKKQHTCVNQDIHLLGRHGA